MKVRLCSIFPTFFIVFSPKVFIYRRRCCAAEIIDVRPPVHHLPFEPSRSRGDSGTTAASLPCRKIIHSMRIIFLRGAAYMIAKCVIAKCEMRFAAVENAQGVVPRPG